MKYYLHDTSAIEDEKVAELFRRFGYEGVGLFYVFLEKIAKQEKPIKTDVLKFQLKVGKRLNKCWNFMEEIGLISSNNGETFNKQLLSFSEKFSIKSEKNRKRISEWREKQRDTENVTRYERVRNAHKEKESKVKESKVKVDREFSRPTIENLENYFLEKGLTAELSKIEAEKFMNFYESKGWMVGKNKMQKWTSAASGWIGRISEFSKKEKVLPIKSRSQLTAEAVRMANEEVYREIEELKKSEENAGSSQAS